MYAASAYVHVHVCTCICMYIYVHMHVCMYVVGLPFSPAGVRLAAVTSMVQDMLLALQEKIFLVTESHTQRWPVIGSKVRAGVSVTGVVVMVVAVLGSLSLRFS